MKKLLILIAVFASLLTCFNACSDNEIELDADDWSTPFGIGGWERRIDNYYGELAYVKGKDAYQFLPDKSYHEVDSLMWLYDYKLRFDSSYTDSIKELVSVFGPKIVLNATVKWSVGSNIAEIWDDFKISRYKSSRNGVEEQE